MKQLPCILTAALLLTLAACATSKKIESDTPKATPPPVAEVLIRANFGKPQSIQESGAGEIPRAYCYLSGLAVHLNATGHVESLTVFPGSDLRKIRKAQ